MAIPKISNLGVHGVIRPAEVDDNLIPDTAVTEAVNFHFDRKGVSSVRLGLSNPWGTLMPAVSGAPVYNPCFALHNSQSTILLAGFVGSIVGRAIYTYDNDFKGWSRTAFLVNINTSTKVRMVDFAGQTVVLDGVATLFLSTRYPITKTGGTSVAPINSVQFASPPTYYTPSMGEAYKSRLYLAGDSTYQSRLFFSSVIDGQGNISWNPILDYVDINPGDGEAITAIKRYSLELLVMKPNYMYRFRTSGVDPDPLIKVGTRSLESMVEGKKGMYFHHESGFYIYSGGYPTEISRPISDIVNAIPFSQMKEICGWKDSDHIYWSLGNITVPETYNSLTIKNCVIRYTESADIWTIYSYPSDVRRGTTFVDATSIQTVLGLDNGVIAVQNSGFTDLGEPIKYRLKTKWYDFGEIAERKVLQDLVGVCEKAQASEIAYQVDDDPTIRTIGQLKKLYNYFYRLSIKFHRIRFIVQGTSRIDSPIFRSFELVKLQNEGVIKE